MKSKQLKYNNLVVKTNLETAFDSRWNELKIEGKNIPSRSNHVAAFFNSRLFIHGGYDVDKGILSDFYCIDTSEDIEHFEWKKLSSTVNGEPIKLKGHTGVVYKTYFVLFGGEVSSSESSNSIYIYDFVDEKWRKPAINNSEMIPKVDSHSALIVDSKIYVYGGYIPDQASYMKNIYCFDINDMKWSTVFESKNDSQPQQRSYLAMAFQGNSLWIFGGTNGQETLDDLWRFDLSVKKWQKIEQINTPQPRRGHSMIEYKGYLFLFGGIQDITKQKNDIYAYQISQKTWNKIHTSTNSIYDCSPTLKQQKRKSPDRDRITLHKVSPDKTDKNGDVMKKILTENKQKKFLQKKKQLLRQFNQKPGQYNKNRSLSPTTDSMLKTLQSIGPQEVTKKDLKQQIMYDESRRYIIGKKPCARDGQSVVVWKQKMYIFGGDRHLMAFNDLYSFDLEKGITSIELYRAN